MARICVVLAVFFLSASSVKAVTLSAARSGPILSPLGGVPLDVYTLTIHANPGARVTAIDVRVTGGLHQVQTANLFGNVQATASIDALTGLPANYVAADTHSLLPLSALIVPPAPIGLLTEDLLPSPGSGMPVEGLAESLTFQSIALSMPQQLESVIFAQVVVRRGTGFAVLGNVATSDDPGGKPVAMIAFPEPASFGIAAIASIGIVGAGRRRKTY